MYPKPQPQVEACRVTTGRLRSTARYGNNGAFIIPGPERAKLLVIASDELGWQHVSVSVLKKPHRCPTWAEMSFVKELFWRDEEAVVQYHPPKAHHVSFHDWTLHLWRPDGLELPLPPHTMVGPQTAQEGLELLKGIHQP